MLKQSMENLRATAEDLLYNKTNRPRAKVHKPVNNGGRAKIDMFIRYTLRSDESEILLFKRRLKSVTPIVLGTQRVSSLVLNICTTHLTIIPKTIKGL